MLETPTAPSAKSPRRTPGQPRLRRDLSDDFAQRQRARGDSSEDEEFIPRRRFSGLRFRLKGGVPRSTVGRIAAGVTAFALIGGFVAGLWAARTLVMHDPRLMLASSASIQVAGQTAGQAPHLTRAQMLSIFGSDIDRNTLSVPLTQRRRELESLPWVEHATVMRLLPNHLRVAVTERTPVAFVRQGSHISLVDATGVLLEMNPDLPADQHYSFPVVTGIRPDDPDSTRAARMKLYQRFTADLDEGPEKLSGKLSEVDLSSPEDVMALIPTGSSDILVHFGDDEFLSRYQRFERNIADWKQGQPNLAAVDMRYGRQVVLETKPGTAIAAPIAADAPVTPAPKTSAAKPSGKRPTNLPAKPTAKPAAKPTAKPAAKPNVKSAAKPVVKPAAKASPTHLQTPFDVHPKPAKKPAAAQ